MSERLLSPEEVAEVLSVTPKTIREWLRKGDMRGIKTGKLWRIREQDLESFIKPAELKPKDIQFDWDSLEKLTSTDFVDSVRWQIKEDQLNGVVHKAIKLKERYSSIYEVYLISDIILVKTFDKGDIRATAFNKYDLEEMLSWLD